MNQRNNVLSKGSVILNTLSFDWCYHLGILSLSFLGRGSVKKSTMVNKLTIVHTRTLHPCHSDHPF